MQLTVERRSFLSGEHRQLGWIEIPTTAPLHIHNHIVEWRHANIEQMSKPASKPVAAPALATESDREEIQRRIRATQLAFLS
jgi:hypothetical protein